jgi:hypothetical protein
VQHARPIEWRENACGLPVVVFAAAAQRDERAVGKDFALDNDPHFAAHFHLVAGLKRAAHVSG